MGDSRKTGEGEEEDGRRYRIKRGGDEWRWNAKRK